VDRASANFLIERLLAPCIDSTSICTWARRCECPRLPPPRPLYVNPDIVQFTQQFSSLQKLFETTQSQVPANVPAAPEGITHQVVVSGDILAGDARCGFDRNGIPPSARLEGVAHLMGGNASPWKGEQSRKFCVPMLRRPVETTVPYDDKTIEDPERDRFYPLRIVGSYFIVLEFPDGLSRTITPVSTL